MVNIDFYTSIGYSLELLSRSNYHSHREFGEYFRTEILSPLRREQATFYLRKNGAPSAFVTWAWISLEVETELHKTGRSLKHSEWNCGNRLFFNDWITPYGNTREIIHDMTHEVFPKQIATSLRRNSDGTVRRINRWTGIDMRKTQQLVSA